MFAPKTDSLSTVLVVDLSSFGVLSLPEALSPFKPNRRLRTTASRCSTIRLSALVIILHALGKDQVAIPAQALPRSFLQQDAKRQQRSLVQAPLVDASSRPGDGGTSNPLGGIVAAPAQRLVEVARVAVHGLEHVAVRQHVAAALGKVLVRKVQVLLCVALRRVLALEEDLFGREDGVGQLVVARGRFAAAACGRVF